MTGSKTQHEEGHKRLSGKRRPKNNCWIGWTRVMGFGRKWKTTEIHKTGWKMEGRQRVIVMTGWKMEGRQRVIWLGGKWKDDKESYDWVENWRTTKSHMTGIQLDGKCKTTKRHRTGRKMQDDKIVVGLGGKWKMTKSHKNEWKKKDDEKPYDWVENERRRRVIRRDGKWQLYDTSLQDTMEDKHRTMNNIGVGGKCRTEDS